MGRPDESAPRVGPPAGGLSEVVVRHCGVAAWEATMRASFGGSQGMSPDRKGMGALLAWLVLGLVAVATMAGPARAQTVWYPNDRPETLTVSDQYVAAMAQDRAAAEDLLRGTGGGGIRITTVDPAKSFVAPHQPIAVLSTKVRGAANAAALRDQLANSPGVVRMLNVYGSGEGYLVETDEFVINFEFALSTAELQQFAQKYDIDLAARLGGYAPNGYLCRVRNPLPGATVATANAIHEQEAVTFSHPNFMVHIVKAQAAPAYTPNDPLYGNQWHLNSTGQLGAQANADINAPEAWDLTTGSNSIVIGVIDDGFEGTHEDFQAPGKVLTGFDAIDNDFDPRPTDPNDAHGTNVAGVITAVQDNGLGVSGVAPGCRVFGVRVIAAGSTTLDIAESFDYCFTMGADVINNSWGLVNPLDPGLPVSLPAVIRQAIDRNTDQGRGGLGAVVTFAAHNYAVDIGPNELASYPKVITVSASTDQDDFAPYSNFGDAVDVCAPSNGGINGITTTDLTGVSGYAPGNYSNDFGGTSSATPVVSGVAALILSMDPNLTRQEVQQILQDTAIKIDQSGGGYDVNGHSRLYGYGKVDAQAAVEFVASTLGTQVTLNVQTLNLNDPNFPGVQPTTRDTAVQVTYTNGRGIQTTVDVYDGQPVTVGCMPGSTVTYAATDIVSGASAGGAAQRWITAAPLSSPVGDQPLTLTGTYYHQLRRNFRVQVQAGAKDVDDAHAVPITLTQLGQPATDSLTSTAKRLYGDTGSTYTIDASATNNTATERWLAEDTRTANETPGVPDGIPDPVTGRISLQQPEVAPKFFHQVMVEVALNGTNSSSVVSTTRRRLLGRDALIPNLFGQFQRFCDNQSPIAFSASSSGSPILQAEGPREFTAAPGLSETINYVIQPQIGTSTVRVFDRTVLARTEVPTTTAPANNRTPVDVVVTIRDSAGSPVTGIAPERVSLFVDPLDGVTVTDPSSATDSTGRLIFQVTSSMPADVAFTATLDGQLIDSNAAASFLQVMTVPLPLPGTYLLTFPITPADSHRAILDFNTTPSPPQMARLIDGTTQYEYFRSDAQNTSFNIIPGRGFFLRTNTSGAAELTGPRAVGPDFELPMGPRGFHQLGNPQATDRMIWRLTDFEVFQNGTSVGLLSNSATWQFVDPFVWSFNGGSYELVVDPVFPGTDGLRTQVGVFEGFFWRSLQDGVSVVYTPDSGRARAAEAPISPANFGVSLTASTGDGQATAVVGAQRQAIRSSAAPASPLDEGDAVRVELVGTDGGRAVADYQGTPVVGPTTWRVQVTNRSAGEPVTLSWPHLSRQLPAGYRARLTDPTNGKSLLLNTHSSYVYTSSGQPREFELTVLPRSAAPLSVVSFQAAASRGRQVSFEATVSGEAELFLRVTSLAGRPVAETSPVTTAGTATLAWDGRDSSGRPVPRGTYQVTLIARNADGETVRAQRTITLR